ncbi:beta-galactosidase [Streptomyces californicus]
MGYGPGGCGSTRSRRTRWRRCASVRCPGCRGTTGLFRGSFTLDGTPGGAGADHAGLELPGWTRGFVWVNGFCLGRYWSVGPQRTLYVPGPVLREGVNEVWVLELEGSGEPRVELGPGAPVAPDASGAVRG